MPDERHHAAWSSCRYGLQAVSVDTTTNELLIDYLVEIEMEQEAMPARLRLSPSASAGLVQAITELVDEGAIRPEAVAAPLLQSQAAGLSLGGRLSYDFR